MYHFAQFIDRQGKNRELNFLLDMCVRISSIIRKCVRWCSCYDRWRVILLQIYEDTSSIKIVSKNKATFFIKKSSCKTPWQKTWAKKILRNFIKKLNCRIVKKFLKFLNWNKKPQCSVRFEFMNRYKTDDEVTLDDLKRHMASKNDDFLWFFIVI